MDYRIYTLPALARALGVGYSVVYTLRARGYLQPTQVNSSREYYDMDDYHEAAARSVAEWRERRNEIVRPQAAKLQSAGKKIDYDAIFARR